MSDQQTAEHHKPGHRGSSPGAVGPSQLATVPVNGRRSPFAAPQRAHGRAVTSGRLVGEVGYPRRIGPSWAWTWAGVSSPRTREERVPSRRTNTDSGRPTSL